MLISLDWVSASKQTADLSNRKVRKGYRKVRRELYLSADLFTVFFGIISM